MVKKIFIGITIFILGMLVGLFCGKKLFDKGKYDQRMDEIMADDIEVERKWLIDKDKVPYDLNDKDVYVYLYKNGELTGILEGRNEEGVESGSTVVDIEVGDADYDSYEVYQ